MQGDSSEIVLAAKDLLSNRYGYELKAMDENFDSDLYKHITVFQQQVGLANRIDNGVIGPATWTALLSNCKLVDR